MLDGRHRWEVTAREGATTTHTCRVCGRVEVHESLVPDAFVEAIIAQMNRPNPYRTMLARHVG
jgi:hypothetical protein